MLSEAALVGFVATRDAVRARAFYQDKLGLRLVSDDNYALVFDANGVALRVQKVETFTPHPFTALGWQVPDIVAAVRALVRKGVSFERYEFLSHDDDGIWRSPSGAQIAWFKDTDGNVLSLTELPGPA